MASSYKNLSMYSPHLLSLPLPYHSQSQNTTQFSSIDERQSNNTQMKRKAKHTNMLLIEESNPFTYIFFPKDDIEKHILFFKLLERVVFNRSRVQSDRMAVRF